MQWKVSVVVIALLLCMAGVMQAAADEPGYSRRGADGCIGCHGDWDPPLLGMFQTPHGNPHDARSPFGERQLQCEACHGPGAEHGGRVRRGDPRPPIINFGSAAWTPVPQQNAMCLDCHEGHVGPQWTGSTHDIHTVACADCHSVHPPQDPMLARRSQADACYACHANVLSDFMKPSAHPVRQGKMACTDCHDPHGSPAEGLLVRSNLNETCYSCHAEKRGPLVWEHAPVVEDCTICHDPHGAVHPALLSRRAPLLCQSCHTPSGHPSVPYDSGTLAGGTASPFVLAGSCMNCHVQVHGSNHPSGKSLMR
jgi:DmsE family decaheme c-type cytochrome